MGGRSVSVIGFIRRYRWWIVIFVVACYFVASARVFNFFSLTPWGDRVTEQNYYRIQIGMTEQEVTEILGRPGAYIAEPWKKFWVGRVDIEVEFDEKTGKVKRKKLSGWAGGPVSLQPNLAPSSEAQAKASPPQEGEQLSGNHRRRKNTAQKRECTLLLYLSPTGRGPVFE
jgi:hypothetical protein